MPRAESGGAPALVKYTCTWPCTRTRKSGSSRRPAEESCYQHFKETYQRNAADRFVVRLPFNSEPNLCDSHRVAKASLRRLEHRLIKQAQLVKAYGSFLDCYHQLDQMERIDDSEVNSILPFCYLLHHQS